MWVWVYIRFSTLELTLNTLRPDTDSEVITVKINNKLNPIIALVIPM